jgi:hypothetical protein
MKLTQIDRDYYGHDERAINKHSVRVYEDEKGQRYNLSRTTDGIPRFFEAYGPYAADFLGFLPRFKVNDRDYWGEGIGWKKAQRIFLGII